MSLTPENVRAARKIELSTPDGAATLVKSGARWAFEEGGPAEDPAVKELLSAVSDLKAVAFVEHDEQDAASFGFDVPQAEIRLTIPGVEDVERFTVGAYTDQNVKRLVYVRRNEVTSIGKVRVADAKALLRGPRAYRDRGVLDLSPSRIERVEMSVENRLAEGRVDMTFERKDDEWTLAAPMDTPVREDSVDKLVKAVAGLRATSVITDEGELTAYGLHAPAATISVTHKPPVEYRIEPPAESDQETEDGEEPEQVKPVEVQPPPETIMLAVTEHDGKIYAKRSDMSAIYELARGFYDQLYDEYRSEGVLSFDDSAVTRLSIRSGESTHVFEKREDRWVYESEPDLPIDGKKVDNLLLQVTDLKTKRFVSHDAEKLDAFGLSAAAHEVTVQLEDGATHALLVSDRVCEADAEKRVYASVRGQAGVFLLPPDIAKRFEVSLADLEKD
jgi:hypothetical protein